MFEMEITGREPGAPARQLRFARRREAPWNLKALEMIGFLSRIWSRREFGLPAAARP